MQIYIDWIFLWWSAYISQTHGHFFVVLKDAFRKIPVVGPGLMFFSWIFLSRHWEQDKQHFQHRMSSLSDPRHRTPMWLLIFPEGTNLSNDTRNASSMWAKKMRIRSFKHTLLPRTRGLQFCLQELATSVDWLYDCTIAYENIP